MLQDFQGPTDYCEEQAKRKLQTLVSGHRLISWCSSNWHKKTADSTIWVSLVGDNKELMANAFFYFLFFLAHLYVWVLWADVSIGQVWKVLEIQNERFGFLLRFRFGKNTNGSVLVLGPPPLVTVGLRQETLNLVLLFQSLWDILHSATMNQLAVNL